MRDIKFRGKKTDNKWIYGDLNHGIITDRLYINGNYLINETVGQLTGLKDKNGVEIYEGDIYHLGDKNIKYIVVWHDTSLIGKQIRASSYAGLSYWLDRTEVIGNMYDNPELLEV